MIPVIVFLWNITTFQMEVNKVYILINISCFATLDNMQSHHWIKILLLDSYTIIDLIWKYTTYLIAAPFRQKSCLKSRLIK